MVMLTITALSRQVVVSRAAESGSAQSLSDEALIKAIADGDRRAMQMLYTRHNVRVYCFILRLINDRSLAEDLVSEVFLVVWQAEGFKAKSQVSTWLLAIARYKALSALRRRSDKHLDDDVLAMIEDPADDPETLVEKEDRRAIFQNCLAQLLAASSGSISALRVTGALPKVIPEGAPQPLIYYARTCMEKFLKLAGVDAF
jgi:RNA polymerase sigma-70 factor (ECF subfamily)